MKAQRLITLLAAAAALAGFAGCEQATAAHKHAVQECVLAPHREAPDVLLQVRDAVRVKLPPPPAGLTWVIASNNNKVLKEVEALARDKDGSFTATYDSIKTGKSVLRFVLVPPGRAEVEPEAVCRVTVRVSDEE